MLLTEIWAFSPFCLGRVVTAVLAPAVVGRRLHVVHQVLERVHLDLVERRPDARSGVVARRGLERAADLDRVLPRLAILGDAGRPHGDPDLVDLGTGPAIRDQPDRVAGGAGP